ncbi:MAG TPA: hypothetical protein VGG72_23015 [Bryobacteraceae bacterium]|jgi:hypothetical protein
MFYSRPQVEPLGWDLMDLPIHNGSKHFDAITSHNRPVDFRFGGGWLSVEIGPVNAPPDGPDMQEVLSIRISPFGTMDIHPEQICDILGLTVNGRKIDSAGMAQGARGFDWSGRTTYWESTHLMQPSDDARMFVQKLREAFPGSMLVQPEWGSHGQLRCRKVKFLMRPDRMVALGLDPDNRMLQRMLSGENISTEEFETTFGFRIDFVHDEPILGDVTGSKYVHDCMRNSGGPELRYSTIQHRRYRISVQYPTEDAVAQSRMRTLLSLIDGSFRRGLRVVNLQTGAVLTENLGDDQDNRSYSIALREEWLTEPTSYLFVGMTMRGDEFAGEGGVFYGARPKS